MMVPACSFISVKMRFLNGVIIIAFMGAVVKWRLSIVSCFCYFRSLIGAHFLCKAERPKRNITEHLLYYCIHMFV